MSISLLHWTYKSHHSYSVVLQSGLDHAERSKYSLVSPVCFFIDGFPLSSLFGFNMEFIVDVMTLFAAPKLQNILKPQHSHYCACGHEFLILKCSNLSIDSFVQKSCSSRRCWTANFNSFLESRGFFLTDLLCRLDLYSLNLMVDFLKHFVKHFLKYCWLIDCRLILNSLFKWL